MLRRRRRWFELFGVLAFCVYLIVVAQGNYHHDYYQLPIVPVGTVLCSVGLVRAARRFGSESPQRAAARLYVAGVVFGVMLLTTFLRSVSANSWCQYDPAEAQLCTEGARLLDRNDLLLFVNYDSPQLLFCLDKRGWLFATSDDPQIVNAWRKGASVLVIRETASQSCRVLGVWLFSPSGATAPFTCTVCQRPDSMRPCRRPCDLWKTNRPPSGIRRS